MSAKILEVAGVGLAYLDIKLCELCGKEQLASVPRREKNDIHTEISSVKVMGKGAMFS